MKCCKCGNEISYRASECVHCGQPEPLINCVLGRVSSVCKGLFRVLAPVVSLAIPFFGFVMSFYVFRKKTGGSHTLGTWYIVSGIACLVVWGFYLRTTFIFNSSEIFSECTKSVGEVRVMQEQYRINNGKYAADLSDLFMMKSTWMSWTCDGLTANDCADAAMKDMAEFCDVENMEYDFIDDGRSYELKVRTADSKQCPVCLNPAGYFPDMFENCPTNNAFVCPSN